MLILHPNLQQIAAETFREQKGTRSYVLILFHKFQYFCKLLNYY
jgi:hypothetical protein